MYQALYNKWRPQTFREVSGQAGITETLLRQSATGRLSHAYLFIGTRGTGKTTCAKILARAANCENLQNGEPCNTCPTCKSILSGSNSDVLEIDAASNSGVENMRALREQTAYLPVEARLRVYIIDECHMLTGPAFNALLKTLEEPPPHVLFILATTELHKVPATILSRCQRFAFRRLDADSLTRRLLEIASAESIPLTERGAQLIARLSDGGMRDAISMLDQCHGVAADTLDESEITEALGLFGATDMLEVLTAITNRDAAAALAALNRVYSEGTDASVFLSELATVLRDVLILHTTGNRALLVGSCSADAISAVGLDLQRAVAMLGCIRDTQSMLYRSINKRLDAEICLIRMAEAESVQPAVTQVAAAPQATPPPVRQRAPSKTPPSDEIPPPPEEDDIPWELPDEQAPARPPLAEPEAAQPQATQPAPKSEPPPSAQGSDIAHNWGAILRRLNGTLDAAEYHIVAKLPHRLEDDRLILSASTMLSKSRLDMSATRETIALAATEALGRDITVVVELAKKEPEESLDRLAGLGERLENFTFE